MSRQNQQPVGSVGQETYAGGSMQEPMGQSSGVQGQAGGSFGRTGGGQDQQMGGQVGTQQFGQSGVSHQQTHQQVGQQFESELTPELNQSLEAFDRVGEIASWCADKCIEMGPEMAECARLCNDLADLAELNEKFIARDSINGPELAETFLRVAHEGLPILEQYQQSPHVQETLYAVDQAIESTNQLLASIGGQHQQGFQEMAQQTQQGQMGQQTQMGQQGGIGQQRQMGQQPQSQQSQQLPQSY